MKKLSVVFLALVLILPLVFISCSKEEKSVAQTVSAPVVEQVSYVLPESFADGIYFAMADSFDSGGWKSTVTVVVEGGKIVDVDWNGVTENATLDKKAYDRAGKYNMVKFGNAIADWHVQAERVEDYIVATQDLTGVSFDADGYTDAISGVTISVDEAFKLAIKALATPAVGKGPYTDGSYFAIEEQYPDSGWKEYINLTVINGNIVAARWNAFDKSGNDKVAYDKAGNYNMVKFGGAQAEWYVQAQRVEAQLIKDQDPNKVDTVSGVSVGTEEPMSLAKIALANGPVTSGPYTDGLYFASQANFPDSGWKSNATLLIKNGNIVDVYISGVNKDGDDKKDFDKAGKYNMVKFGGAQAEWYEQAERVENFILETQDIKAVTYNASGETDVVSGVSIAVDEYVKLLEAALAAGPR